MNMTIKQSKCVVANILDIAYITNNSMQGIPMAEEKKKKKDIVTVETLELEDKNGNVFKAILWRNNDTRTYKVEYELNDMRVKPATFLGRHAATTYWDFFKSSIKSEG